MIRPFRQALTIAACAWWWLSSAPASAPTDLVSIHVAVEGPILGTGGVLTQDDFVLSIDGRPAAIASLTPPPTPLTILLLLDKTISMETYGGIDDEVAKSFVPALQAGDRARFGGIASRFALAPAFSSNPREILATGRAAVTFRREERAGPSPIWDAMERALDAIEPEPGLRAILLVSDGRGTGNRTSQAAVRNRAISSGVVVSVLSEALPVILRQSETTAARVRPGLALEEMARATGGLIAPADPTPSTVLPPAGSTLARFVNDLRGMYTITVPAVGTPGSMHPIDVKIVRPGLTARTRRAYRTPG
jgi:hypothetical protein